MDRLAGPEPLRQLLVALMLFFVLLGCFLDGISMVVLTMGVILPTIQKAGIDPLWFGIFVVLVVEMAQITPPVGFNLFVLQGMTARSARDPFFFLMLDLPARRSSPGCRRLRNFAHK
jgi:C4-dicarboxylate transporter, DctM subunit